MNWRMFYIAASLTDIFQLTARREAFVRGVVELRFVQHEWTCGVKRALAVGR